MVSLCVVFFLFCFVWDVCSHQSCSHQSPVNKTRGNQALHREDLWEKKVQ